MNGPLKPRSLIAMIHVQALPGSPRSRLSVGAIAQRAGEEAALLAKAGFDGLIIENMHDAPYVAGAQGPEVVAAMTCAGMAVRAAAPGLALGVQVLACGNREALAVALAVGASFVRVENFVFAHVADEGLLPTAEAGALLRYRKQIGAGHVKVFADIKKKHASHVITADVDIAEAAKAAEFFGADGVIVTGTATGRPVDEGELGAVRGATRLPVLVGSGVTPESAPRLMEHADALIVGSWIKRRGVWSNGLDKARCEEMVRSVRGRAGGTGGTGGRRGRAKGR